MFQQYVGDRVANLGFDFVNGTENSLEPLRKLLEEYKDDFTPNTRIEWDDHSFDTVLALSQQETKWKINIPPLADRVEGISGGHFVVVGARPNTGKTSFHASIVAGANGFAHQGAKCIVLVMKKLHTCSCTIHQCVNSMTMKEVHGNKALAARDITQSKITYSSRIAQVRVWIG